MDWVDQKVQRNEKTAPYNSAWTVEAGADGPIKPISVHNVVTVDLFISSNQRGRPQSNKLSNCAVLAVQGGNGELEHFIITISVSRLYLSSQHPAVYSPSWNAFV